MQLPDIRDILQKADVFGYIKLGGTTATIYDAQASIIHEKLSNDLTIKQIAKIVWEAYNFELCNNINPLSKEVIVFDKKQGQYLMGTIDRFNDIAKLIREKLKY